MNLIIAAVGKICKCFHEYLIILHTFDNGRRISNLEDSLHLLVPGYSHWGFLRGGIIAFHMDRSVESPHLHYTTSNVSPFFAILSRSLMNQGPKFHLLAICSLPKKMNDTNRVLGPTEVQKTDLLVQSFMLFSQNPWWIKSSNSTL